VRLAPRTAILAGAIGLGSGIVAGLFGIGGGVVIVPALVLILGLAQLEAAAVSLVAIAVGTTSALIPFITEGRVVLPAGLTLAVGAIAGAFTGSRFAHRIPERVLAWTFVAVVGAAAVRMLIPSGGGVATGIELDPVLIGMLLGIGFGAGVLSVLLGIGGGIIYVPSLVILADVAQHTAQGTSLVAILPAALVGVVGHARAGRMRWRLAGAVSIGSFLGGFGGAWLAQRVAADRLQVAFGILLVVMAVRMAVSATRSTTPSGPPP
jgi:uncharacterized membrane protein YfcA